MCRFAAEFPEFDRVDDVLPKHITACTYRGHRIKIGVGHPDGEGSILLEGGLTTVNLLTKMTTHAAANKKENETEYKAEQGNHEHQRETCFAVDNVTNGDTRRDTELDGP